MSSLLASCDELLIYLCSATAGVAQTGSQQRPDQRARTYLCCKLTSLCAQLPSRQVLSLWGLCKRHQQPPGNWLQVFPPTPSQEEALRSNEVLAGATLLSWGSLAAFLHLPTSVEIHLLKASLGPGHLPVPQMAFSSSVAANLSWETRGSLPLEIGEFLWWTIFRTTEVCRSAYLLQRIARVISIYLYLLKSECFIIMKVLVKATEYEKSSLSGGRREFFSSL